MKFSRILGNLRAEIFPEWRDMFLSYKSLKKRLNVFYPKAGIGVSDGEEPPAKRQRSSDSDAGESVIGVSDGEEPPAKRQRSSDSDAGESVADAAERGNEAEVRKEVADFIGLLDDEIEKFNEFFLKKEEDYIIAWKELRDRIAKAKDSNEDLSEVGRKLVDLHGEMVLLEIYSILNYTGLVKITKKHDKRSGALIRLPFIQTVLDQPFFSIEVVNNLVRECEVMLDDMFSRNELAEIEHLNSAYAKLTLLALQVLEDIRSGSSTVSPLSLPPMSSSAIDGFKSMLVAEQVATAN